MTIKNKITASLIHRLLNNVKIGQTIVVGHLTLEVVAMSTKRKDALKKVSDLQLIISEHLFKYIYVDSPDDKNHWLSELEAWRQSLSRANKGKSGSNNYLNEYLMDKLWEDPFGEKQDLELWFRELVQTPYSIDKDYSNGKRLKKFIEKFINCILTDTRLTK